MSIIGIGTDIVSIGRVRCVPDLARFAEYVLLPSERNAPEGKRDFGEFVASRFALKEAVVKAYPRALNYHDIETRKDGEKIICKISGDENFRVDASISHSFENAIAMAIVSS